MASSLEEASPPPPPSAFCCPISLELMTDPVTLSSGITYDRASIQRWLSAGHLTCPVTRLPLLPHPSFTPNHTLLRIIRSWSLAHSSNLHPSATATRPRHIYIGQPCTDALFELGLLDSAGSELIPLEQAIPLLISIISYYGADACHGNVFADERTCADALAQLSILPLSSHHLICLSHPHILSCLSHFLCHTDRRSRINTMFLLTKLTNQHPSQQHFLQKLSSESHSALIIGLAQILKQSNTPTFLAQDILQSLCLLCKSSSATRLSLTDESRGAIVYVALEQLLHNSAHRGASPISERALSLLEIVAGCAEGRDAIASHAFAVPTIARFLERSVSEAVMAAAAAVLWKMCRYSSWERVRRQARAACVPSKLVLLMQANHLGRRGRKKAGALVRLLVEEGH